MGRDVEILVFNGLAASARAWEQVRFPAPPRIVGFCEPEPEPDGVRRLLVGWSMGGSRALDFACRAPGDVAGMVLVAATPRMMEDRSSGWAGMSPRRLAAFRRAVEALRGERLFGVPEGVPNPYQEEPPDRLDRGFAYLERTDLRERVARTFAAGAAFPVRVVQSERDAIVNAANAAWLGRIFPQASVTLVPGGEHALPAFAPEAVSAAVAECLDQLETDRNLEGLKAAEWVRDGAG